jgi:hypothetical protein
MNRMLLIFVIISFSCISYASPNPLSVSPTVTFSSAVGFSDQIAQDGDGGSIPISDLNLLIMPINSSGGLLSGSPLQFHSGAEPSWTGYPAIITFGDVNANFGWAIKSDNGGNFSLISLNFLDWGGFMGDTYVVQAFDNDVSLGTVTFTGNTTTTMVAVTNTAILNAKFKNVDEVRIYQQGGADSYISLNSVKVGTAVAALPVKWENVSVEAVSGTAEIHWSTNEERNTKDYSVLHSVELLSSG